MTFQESTGKFLYTNFSSFFDLTIAGIQTFLGFDSPNKTGLAFSLDGNTLYALQRFGTPQNLFTLDPSTGKDLTATPITLAGETVFNGNALAIHPTTGELWAVLRVFSATSDRVLVTVDPSGVATFIGDVGRISALAFDSSGTLFAVLGEAATPPETLVTLSQTDATQSILCVLGNGGGGEAIGFNPNDGSLYHMSGSIFEKIIGFNAPPFAINAQRLALFSIDRDSPLLHEIELPSGNVINTVFIKTDFKILGGAALTTDSNNQMYAVLNPGGGGEESGDRDFSKLTTINPITGGTGVIGILSDSINGLAFKDGILFGVTPRNNLGPLPDTALVSINLSTAEVTLICDLDSGRQPNIALNPENNSLYYFTDGNLEGKITDTSGDDCKVKAPGGGGGGGGGNGNGPFGFIFDYVSYAIISMILPPAEAGNGECESTRGVTWWGAESTFIAGSFCLQTIDPDTGDDGEITDDLGHNTKGLAFAFVGRSGGGGGHGNPTIGVNDNGVLVVTCGVNFDGQCFTITAPFHEEFKLYEMMSGTHTISITMYCANGVTTCNYAAIAIMPYSESMDNTTWKIELYKDNEGNLTTVTTDPEGYLGTITVTTQIIDDKFWVVSFTVDFKNKDTGPMMFGVQVRDNYNAIRNWYLNEGVEFIDSDAYPTIETEFDESLEVDSLCLNEDPTYRYSCAFAEILERTIQNAEETLRQMLNGEYIYK